MDPGFARAAGHALHSEGQGSVPVGRSRHEGIRGRCRGFKVYTPLPYVNILGRCRRRALRLFGWAGVSRVGRRQAAPDNRTQGGHDAPLERDHLLHAGFQACLLPADRFRPLLRRRRGLRLPLTPPGRTPAGIAARREAGILPPMPDAVAIVAPEPPWELFRARLLDYVRRRLDDPAEAEDLVQEVLARVSGRLPELRTREHLLPWLYRITRNALIDHYRARGRRPPLTVLDTVTGTGPGSLATGEDEDPGADARAALAGCVEPMLATLPPAYREALHRVELLGERQVDVAEELGLGISALKSRVQRGRKLLHDAFTDCCAVERDSAGGVVGFERREGSECSG